LTGVNYFEHSCVVKGLPRQRGLGEASPLWVKRRMPVVSSLAGPSQKDHRRIPLVSFREDGVGLGDKASAARLGRDDWLSRKLEDRCFLALQQIRQQDGLPVLETPEHHDVSAAYLC
jgi:hypothetical protein